MDYWKEIITKSYNCNDCPKWNCNYKAEYESIVKQKPYENPSCIDCAYIDCESICFNCEFKKYFKPRCEERYRIE